MSTAAQTPVIGGYRLLGHLGEGGMGVVHLAETPAGEQVALKVLRPNVVGDEEGRSRLAREVTSLRRVRGPWVAEVIDASPWGETPYVVTRYVAGPSLDDLVRRSGPLSPRDLGALAYGLAEGMEAVHRADVVHRDIKPTNVLIEERAPVLIDFGLARLVDDSRITVTGWLLGTPGYLAPEILHGEPATPAADVHAWAATVVFAGTGRSPYGDGPAVAVMDRTRRGEHDLSGLPENLRPVLGAALAPDPRQRPSAAQVLRWLDDLERGKAVTARVAAIGGNTGASTRPVTLAGAYAYQPPRPSLLERVTRLVVAGSLLVALVAAAVAAPVIAALVLGVVLLLAGAASRMGDALASRRSRRGRRGSDPWWAVLLSPWYLLAALPGALALAAVAVGGGALVAAVVASATTAGWRWQALVAGGLATALIAWWGPLSPRPRAAGRRLVARLAAPSAASWAYVATLLGVAAVLGLLWLAAGTSWWPTGPPPTWAPPWLDGR